MKKSIQIFAVALLTGFTLTSCNTSVESVDLDQPSAARYAEIYQNYLTALRNYKTREHKKVYAWFDNTDSQTYSRYQHITDVPDSIDVLVLTKPAAVTAQTSEEMTKVRAEKGMKVIYDVDFDAIKADYITYTEGMEGQPAENILDFSTFLMNAMQTQLGYCTKFNFDGIMIRYTGKTINHMEKEELAEYKAQEGLFMGIIKDWTSRHADKFFAFTGKPQNVADNSLFDICKILLVSEGFDATSKDSWTLVLRQATVEGVPAEKLGMTVSCTSLSDDDIKTGWFSNGSRAIASMGQWAYYANVAGVGVANLSSDYFNNTYSYSRAMIQGMTPAGSK